MCSAKKTYKDGGHFAGTPPMWKKTSLLNAKREKFVNSSLNVIDK
jgi:hypothetical protein